MKKLSWYLINSSLSGNRASAGKHLLSSILANFKDVKFSGFQLEKLLVEGQFKDWESGSTSKNLNQLFVRFIF